MCSFYTLSTLPAFDCSWCKPSPPRCGCLQLLGSKPVLSQQLQWTHL